MEFGLNDHTLTLIRNAFKKIPAIKEVVIYGSRAMGNYKKISDIDLALKGNITFDTLAHIKNILEEELPVPYSFDVLNYHDLHNKDLKNHIDAHGKIFYIRADSKSR
ncbi:MAG: hypothetical protein A2298_04960 [Gammaproteobacteria bacterium RIFOXYB2_FULL_38_6]|nr:MAG: hypothetical protein A2298_04960 [Gammaproteobacteria bacterium RIFOXYB2_FULL_38_6]